MGFLDETVITARSGDGGKGCISFRREKFIPKGGPDGGDGGNGGSVIIRATRRLNTLTDFTAHKYFRAPDGEPGRGKNQFGKNGPDLIIDVPLGTIIEDSVTGELLADLIHDKQEFLLLPGGKGGKGNQHFATSVNRAPRISQIGLPGQERSIRLSLKFIADIGLIGLPNTGKSTLLSRLSMARPKIDKYPFTTLTPNLGVMIFDDERSLVIADIPGLIEGASAGRGLGHRFLKHIERTQLLLHLLDATYLPDQDILGDFESLIHEMEIYNPALVDKPKIVLINKMDIYSAQHRDIKTIRMNLTDRGIESLPISALTGAGIEKLKKIIIKKWGKGL
jgi:GTP-binding protein